MTARPSSRPPFSEEDSPVVVNERKPVTMPLALLATLIAFTAAATFAYAALGQRIDSATEKAKAAQSTADAIEIRTRAIETTQERMASDIGWIRRAMEEDRRARSMVSSRNSAP